MAEGAYDVGTDVGRVRLLLNDVTEPYVFTDLEVRAFLELEGGSVKRAAAQAIDTNADSEVLASKVLRSQDVSTDGAKVADALRKRATELRRQAEEDEGGFFEIIGGPTPHAELTEWPVF